MEIGLGAIEDRGRDRDVRIVGDDAINNCVAKVRRLGEASGAFGDFEAGYVIRDLGLDPNSATQARSAEERALLQRALAELPGVKAWPSDANMILARFPDAQKTFDGLKAHGVLVKNVSRMHPLLANCLRLTVGTPEENALMISALRASLR